MRTFSITDFVASFRVVFFFLIIQEMMNKSISKEV